MSFLSKLQRLATVTTKVLGNEVVVDETTGCGLLTMPSEEIVGEMVVSNGYMLEVTTEAFGTIEEGTVIVVDGVEYVARQDARPVGDGTMSMIPLQIEPPQPEE